MLVLLAGSLASIRVSCYGVGMEIGSHAYPGCATLGVALGFLMLSFPQALVVPAQEWPGSSGCKPVGNST